jgi:hypothetical protein
MALVRLDIPLARLGDVVRCAGSQRVVYSCTDANTVMCAASLRGDLHGPFGVWLDVGPDYSAQMAARDVKTLSWIIDLDDVVISATHDADQQADVVRALLTNDEVNFTNDVATIRAAFNRPAPTHPITVWSWNGAELRSSDEELHLLSSDVNDVGETTTYA